MTLAGALVPLCACGISDKEADRQTVSIHNPCAQSDVQSAPPPALVGEVIALC